MIRRETTMHKKAAIFSRSVLMACTAILLCACATATPFRLTGGQKDNALIEGDSGMLNTMPVPGSFAFLEKINGKDLNASQSDALIPPGKYTIGVDCQIHAGTLFLQDHQDITFSVLAGHVYKFQTNIEDRNSGCNTFPYDATGGAGPYPETVHIDPPANDNQWKGSGKAYGGHSIQDWVPNGQNQDHWTRMIEIEYWSNLVFPQSADEFFESQVIKATQTCPDLKTSITSEKKDDVIYRFDNNDCKSSDIRAQIGRFMTGKYGVYEVTYMSKLPIADTSWKDWLQSLENAHLVEQH